MLPIKPSDTVKAPGDVSRSGSTQSRGKRSDSIAEIRAQIKSGSYTVNFEHLASKILTTGELKK